MSFSEAHHQEKEENAQREEKPATAEHGQLARGAEKQSPVLREGDSEEATNGNTPSAVIIDGIKSLNPLRLLEADSENQAIPPGLATQREVASLQTQIKDVEHDLKQLNAEISRLKSSLRSGLISPLDFDAHELEDLMANQNPVIDLATADAAPSTGSPQEKGLQSHAQRSTLTEKDSLNHQVTRGPYEILESAAEHIEMKDFPKAIVLLESLREKYAGYADEGLGDLLLAESWLQMQAPERSLPALERMLGKNPRSPHVPRAKLAQAQSLRMLGERERATQILLEVLAIDPQSRAADLARAELELMKTESFQ